MVTQSENTFTVSHNLVVGEIQQALLILGHPKVLVSEQSFNFETSSSDYSTHSPVQAQFLFVVMDKQPNLLVFWHPL